MSDPATSTSERNASSCLQKAMDFLARRPHFKRELVAKLAARKFAAEEIDQVMTTLDRRGWLDDRGCARNLIEGSWRRKGFGPRRMRAELGKRGVSDEILDDVLRDAWDTEGEDALRVAESWFARRTGRRDRDDQVNQQERGAIEMDRAALARHLERKGFGGHAIHQALSRLGGLGSTPG